MEGLSFCCAAVRRRVSPSVDRTGAEAESEAGQTRGPTVAWYQFSCPHHHLTASPSHLRVGLSCGASSTSTRTTGAESVGDSSGGGDCVAPSLIPRCPTAPSPSPLLRLRRQPLPPRHLSPTTTPAAFASSPPSPRAIGCSAGLPWPLPQPRRRPSVRRTCGRCSLSCSTSRTTKSAASQLTPASAYISCRAATSPSTPLTLSPCAVSPLSPASIASARMRSGRQCRTARSYASSAVGCTARWASTCRSSAR